MPAQLIGVLPVLATTFRIDDEIDFSALEREIAWLFDQGADGVVMGMVSETLRLSSEERDRLAAACCEFTNGRGTVTTSVGAGGEHPHGRPTRTVRRGERCHRGHGDPAGGHGHVRRPGLRYYARLLDAIDIPVVIQDASGYLGRSVPVDVQTRLFLSYGGRALFKPEAQPIGPRLSALRDATGGGASVYEGSGGLALVDSFHRGIAGTMPGPDVVWAIVAIWKALQAGDEDRVAAIHGPLCALLSIQTSLDAFIAIEKHLLQRQGVLANTYSRRPVGFELDDETRLEADRLLDQLQRATSVAA